MANFYGSLTGFGGGGEPVPEFMTVSSTVTPTTDGDYKIHRFTGTGTFTVSAVGSDATYGDAVEYLIVAGGGGGGHQFGGGGGAGGYRTD